MTWTRIFDADFYAQPLWLFGLAVVPVAALLFAWSIWRRYAAAKLFTPNQPRLTWRQWKRRWSREGVVTVALALIAFSLARPQWNPKEEEVPIKGRDVVFLVDVSRSMLSQDVSPSRLGRAKLWIDDVIGSVKGDRVGLVAFAGASVITCPLTLDYGFFRMSLDELSPNSVPRGGTLIGDAIRKTVNEVFDNTEGRGRDIILITDGEDQESYPVQAAEQAGKQGIRIIAIGIGSEQGSLVPGEGTSVVTYNGERVRSKMDASGLAQIAGASKGGVFFNVGTGTIDLERVYQDLIASAEKSEIGKQSIVHYDEKFQVFLVLAFCLLTVEVFLLVR